ncbi:ATP-grasp domain-containing protein [Mucilaginibacter ginkgonis]|uniref:Circularly permuted ATP-grasp superfamily protein n=1 Tax=Mucilaginibacter ginkgonis TaxID=2682091 RepID=A0A6I4I052_9SPHI|nr:hypothetical protein [Mucilaginibacter ginkgonis]QQL48891.1 hypothetical protein GO620_011960 [Mucilaginibacter ginkgonis]
MEPSARKKFNDDFTEQKFADLLDRLNKGLPNPVAFRVAETPIFIPDDFLQKLVAAGDDILKTILRADFKQLTETAIPEKWKLPNENDHPHFIALDFGVCKDDNGDISPKLIELQGFPSLYAFQVYLSENYKSAYNIDADWEPFLSGLDKESYIDLFRRTILGDHQPHEVVLMDVNAHEQKTAVDFLLTEKYLGIKTVALEELEQRGDKLFYYADDELVQIKRIYNRLIFDEIENDPDIFNRVVDIRQPLDVEWVTHPNWFYRISKYTMPFLEGAYIPKSVFANDLKDIPSDLENYVLKPLFSFAGQGVIIDVKPQDISNLKNPENWILQEKVNYEPVVQTPEGGVKAEIRLLYLWPDGDDRPTLAINLARLSRGKMIGVRYNKDFNWVGGTAGLVTSRS